MFSKKIVITSISISLIIHIAILTLAGIIDMPGNNHREVFTVDLKKPSSDLEKIIDKKGETKVSRADFKDKPEKICNITMYEREDTVNLDSMDIKYCSYLEKLRKNIWRNWSYPQEAYIQKEEGTAIIKFSITGDGFIGDLCMITSSGFKSLDTEAIKVVKLSAPYAPLPQSFHLSKLNIVAKFQYRLIE